MWWTLANSSGHDQKRKADLCHLISLWLQCNFTGMEVINTSGLLTGPNSTMIILINDYYMKHIRYTDWQLASTDLQSFSEPVSESVSFLNQAKYFFC